MEDFLEMAPTIIVALGWLLVIAGTIKLLLWMMGEFFPRCWSKIKSPSMKSFLTGPGNRIVFGIGGLVTLLLGAGAILAAKFIIRLNLELGL